MELIATCIEGLESITQLEIKEILKQKSEIIIPSRIKFKVKIEKDTAKFITNTRSSIKIYKLLNHFQFTKLEEIYENINRIKFPKIKSPFVVRCERTGIHDFNSMDVEREVGDIINKNNKLKVDLKNPTTIILIDIVNNNCFVGIDLTDIKLSRRPYRIKLLPNPINPCIAYAMLRIAEVKDKDIILDSFCRSGEILIEAALYLQNIPVNQKLIEKLAFTKLIKFKLQLKTKTKKIEIYAIEESQNNLRSAEINAKIAGINKSITFSRCEIEWLDTKFKKNSIDKIITFPIFPTNNIPKEKIEKTYKEFLYQSEFILKKNGTITLLTPVPELIEKYAQSYKFKKYRELKISYMNSSYFILVLKKAF